MGPAVIWVFALTCALLAIHIARDWRDHPPEAMEFDRPLLRAMAEGLGWIVALMVTTFAIALSGLLAPFAAIFLLWLLLAIARRYGYLRRLHALAPISAILGLACSLYLFQATVGDVPVPALENLIPKE